jgi:hypothetical protein
VEEIVMKYKLVIGLIAAGTAATAAGLAWRHQSAASGKEMGDSPASATPDAKGMKTVEVVDPFFGQRAFTVTIPAGWKLEGTVLRGADRSAPPDLVFRAYSPDGLTGVQSLPHYEWAWANDPWTVRQFRSGGLAMRPPGSVGDFVKSVVIPEIRPGAHVGAVGPVPELSDALPEQDRKTNAQIAEAAHGRPQSHVKTDAARVRIEYDFNGQPVEEWIVAITSSTEHPGNVTPSGGIARILSSKGFIKGARAPRGQLDSSEPSLRAIFGSFAADPSWTRKQGEFMNREGGAQQAHMLERAQRQQADIMAQSRRNLDAIHRKGAAILQAERNSEAARHGGAVETIKHMGDQETYVNPATGQIGRLSNQNTYNYANENGETVQTNSPTFDPNAQLRGNWTQLQPVKGQ